MKRFPRGAWMKLKSKEVLQSQIAYKGYSHSRLARYAGCSRGMVSHLTAGRKTSCTTDLAVRLAEALDVSLDALFEVRASSASSKTVTGRRESAA